MKLTFIELPPFTNRWRREALGDEKLQELQTAILEDPEAGDSMPRTGGLRKSASHRRRARGKERASGIASSTRTLRSRGPSTCSRSTGKWDKADLTPAEEKYYREVLTALKDYHRRLAGESDSP